MSTDDSKTRATDPPPPAKTYLVDGQQRYRVDARLGGGGFGAVFKCWHEQTATWVAIKRVHVPDADAAGLTREATLLGLVDSDYVAKTRASFFDEANSLLYLVSDLATEGDLRQYLRTRPTPLPVREAVELALGIARGLAALHARDIVHRDLKPANVLIFRRDHRLLPRLSDFGLARNEASLSLGEFVSPGYSAPEQFAFERTGPESDRFSFGLLLYELLTGSPATDARELTAYAAWLAALKTHPLELASARRPELADWPQLEALVCELTTFDRAARQRISSAAVVATLEDVLARTEADAGAAAQEVRVPPTARTRTIALRVLAIVILLGLSALTGFWLVSFGGVRPGAPSAGTGPDVPPAPQTPGRASVAPQSSPSTKPPAGVDDGPDPGATTPAAGGAVPGTTPATSSNPPAPSPAAVEPGENPPAPAPAPPPAAPPIKPDGPLDRGQIIGADGPVSPGIDPSFKGRWTGTLDNPAGQRSSMSVSVELTGPDTALTGTVSLDDGRCRGTWVAAEAVALRRVWFEQKVTGSDCVRQARVRAERAGEHLSVALFADGASASMGSGRLVRAVDGTGSGTTGRRGIPLWALGTFIGTRCIDDRDFNCRLSVRSNGEVTFAAWFRVAGEFTVQGRIQANARQVQCPWESSFLRITCKDFSSDGYVAYDLSEGRNGGLRMTRADRTRYLDLERDK